MFKFWLFLSGLNLIAMFVYVFRIYVLFYDRLEPNKNNNKIRLIYIGVKSLFDCLFPLVHIFSLYVFIKLIFCNEKELEFILSKKNE